MRTQLTHHLLAALIGVVFTAELHAQSTAFTYQGQLTDGSVPATGLYDLQFTIYDANTAGNALAGPITNSAVVETNGLFATMLDFGPGVFDGNDRWLEIGVAANGSGVFTNLSPRQFIASAPYAIQAANAASADSVNAEDITGMLELEQFPTTVVTNGASGVNFSGTFSGDGSGLIQLDSTRLTGPLSMSANLVNIGHIDNGGQAFGVAVAGNYAYLANNTDGLRVYEIGNPSSPINVGHIDNGGQAFGVAVAGNYAYLANSSAGLRVYDISNPTNVISVGDINDGGEALGVAAAGNYAYLANFDDGLRVYDISNPTNVINVGHIDSGGFAYAVAVADNYAYLANDTDGLRVYDVSNASNPIHVGHINNGGAATGVAVSGHYAYLANRSGGLRLYDISDPTNPINVGHIDNGGFARDVAVAGNFAYLANQDDGLRVYELIQNAVLTGGLTVSNTVSAAAFVGDGSGLTNAPGDNLGDHTATQDLNLNGYQINGVGDYRGRGHLWLHAFEGDGNSGTAYVQARDDSGTSDIALRLRTQNAGTIVDAMHISTNGNVGIGMTTPGRRLTVTGAAWDNSPTGGGDVKITNPDNIAAGLTIESTASGGKTYSILSTGPSATAGAGSFAIFDQTESLYRFVLNSTGQVGIGRHIASFPLQVGTDGSNGNGAHVTPGGAWVNGSSRTWKENFLELDPGEILERVVALPILRWNYTGSGEGDHIGPMAEDFHAAFDLGHDENYIATVDADGVALAAIQGLNEKVEGKSQKAELRSRRTEDRIQKLEAENAELRSAVSELKALVEAMDRKLNGGAR